ncbi:hypothetical protein Tco_0912280, partial [Tanacetum coccineum]
PHFKHPLFNAPEFTWSVEYSTFGDGISYFFYILKKVSSVDLATLFTCLNGDIVINQQAYRIAAYGTLYAAATELTSINI